VIERELCYLPRSRQLSRYIPPLKLASSADVQWWNPPDETILYDESKLAEATRQACRVSFASDRDMSDWMERDTRSEELERCKLLLRVPELIKADVVKLSVSNQESIVHRCYFHQPSPTTLWAKVYRYGELVRGEGYSAYFENADLSDSSFLQSMYNSAIPLMR
jgi:hypothetical protein